MSDLLFDSDDVEEQPDESMVWARKLVVGEQFDRPPLGHVGPDDLQILEQQFRRNGPPAPVLFDDGDGVWNRAEFASAMGIAPESLTLEDAEQWLLDRYAGRV